MKYMTYLAAAVLLAFCVSGAVAVGWVEQFQTYPSNNSNPLTAPWEGVGSQGCLAGIGFNASKGSFGPGAGWEYGHAYRPTTGGTILIGRFYMDPLFTYQGVQIGLVPNKNYSSAGQIAGGADQDSAVFAAGGNGDTTAYIMIVANDYDSSGNYVADRRIVWQNYTGLVVGNWYDVKMVVSNEMGYQVTGSFKLSSDTTWNDLGTLDAYPSFAPNYVGISCNRGGYIDDIGFGDTDVFPPVWVPSEFGTIAGTVTLDDFTGNKSLLPVRLRLHLMDDSLYATQVITTETSNAFSFANVEVGDYKLYLESGKSLTALRTNIVVTNNATTTLPEVLLINDPDGDNAVTSSDLSVILKSMDVVGDN